MVSPKPAAEPAELNPPQSWDEKLPDEVDVDVALYDWLFALEGVGGAAGRENGGGGEDVYSHCWHSRFEKLQVAADSSAKGGKKSAPLQEVMVSDGTVEEPMLVAVVVLYPSWVKEVLQ